MENNELLLILRGDYEQAFKFRERRHSEWNENYTLYRNKVVLNRLTQRQNVNIPLMKETIRTWLANIDDVPDVIFEDVSDIRKSSFENEEEYLKEFGMIKEREIALNEYWGDFFVKQQLEIKDIVDKKQVGLYGRSFKKLNVVDGKPTIEIIDPQDILVDRYVDPSDIDTAQFVFHVNIYKTLKSIENNKNYDREAIKRLKEFYASEKGLIKATENYQVARDKAERLERMGVPDVDHPVLGETYVELNECYRKFFNEEKSRWEIYLIVMAGDYILMKKPLEEVIGKTKDGYWANHYPFSTWADDVERTDFWSDSLADTVRQINKVLNAWVSQLIENRTLRNFGMHYYNSSDPRFVPQTYEPRPWGWYPVPGDPDKLIKKVEVPDLRESLQEMTFLINIAEKATAITSIMKGVSERRQITLGEVEILASKAQERAIATVKFYRHSWKDFAYRWYKIIEAQSENLEEVVLSKKSWNGRFYSRVVNPRELISKSGYLVRVLSSAEQEARTLDNIQKFVAVVGQMPNNKPLKKIFQKKILEMLNLNPEEIKEVLDFEEQSDGLLKPTVEGLPVNVVDAPEAGLLTEKN